MNDCHGKSTYKKRYEDQCAEMEGILERSYRYREALQEIIDSENDYIQHVEDLYYRAARTAREALTDAA